jgi:dolichol-phosphate mannosyltransferase
MCKKEQENYFLNHLSQSNPQILSYNEKVAKEKISIIIPTYNEKGALRALVEKINLTIQKVNLQAEIILVDDNSPDGTGKLADILAENKNNIKVIHRPRKLGLGSAYKTAIQNAEGEAIITMDGDFSHNPEELPRLIETWRSHKVDIVIGSRYIKKNSLNGWSLQRKLISQIGNLLARYILRLRIRDLTSGFRVYRTTIIKRMLNEIHSDGFFFQVEVIYQAKKKGFKVKEKEISFVNRQSGRSNLSFIECFVFFFSLFRLKNH